MKLRKKTEEKEQQKIFTEQHDSQLALLRRI